MHRSLIVWIMLMALGCSVGYADSLPVAPAQVCVPVMDRSAAALQQGVQAAFAQAMLHSPAPTGPPRIARPLGGRHSTRHARRPLNDQSAACTQ